MGGIDMKKIVYVFLIMTMLFSIIPNNGYAEGNQKEGIFTYTVLNNEATIIQCDISASGDIVIPSTLGGYPVTTIKEKSFDEGYLITSIVVPESIINISDGVFSNHVCLTNITVDSNNKNYSSMDGILFNKDKTKLLCYPPGKQEEAYTVSGSVKSIGKAAFQGASIKHVAIPDQVSSIEDYAFEGCDSLIGITLPQGLESISSYMLRFCTGLTDITIPESTKTIGDFAFEGCSGLKEIFLPKNITSIGRIPFALCSNLVNISAAEENKNYTTENGILFNKDKTELICLPEGFTDTSYVVPSSITKIGCNALSNPNLINVTLNSNVREIGDCAFSSCGSLTNLIIPDSVKSIGKGAFMVCYSLESITLPKDLTRIEDFMFTSCAELKSINLPAGITTIGVGAFSQCNTLESITIPDKVTNIGDSAFMHCNALARITIPESVTNIGVGTFFNCSALTDIAIPAHITNIGEEAFEQCYSLSNIKISDGVKSIGARAFSECSSLKSIAIPNSVTSIGEGAFVRMEPDETGLVYRGIPLRVEQGSYAEYYAVINCISFAEEEKDYFIDLTNPKTQEQMQNACMETTAVLLPSLLK